MTKSRIFTTGVSALITAIMVALPLSAAFADSTFYFSDDFSTGYSIDASQTSHIQTQNGGEFLEVGGLNGSVTSTVINQVNGTISSAKIDAQMTLPVGTFVLFYLSNDNGTNWYQVQRGVTYLFPHPGSQLRWRALMSRTLLDFNPFIDSVTVQYTIVGNVSNSSGQYYYGTGSGFSLGDPQGMVCSALSFIGLGCNTSSVATTAYQPQISPLNFNIFGSNSTATSGTSSSTSNSDLTAAIATTTTKDLSGNDINLVKVAGDSTIYELINGQKHAFPTITIFASYGYTSDMVQTISQAQLDKYPRAGLVKVHGTSQIYYLTNNGMVRPIPNDTVLASYGDRKHDVIEISQKEFGFYPQNQYVYLESPLNRDVFQISSAGKRYLTPMAVARLGIKNDQVAPVNQAEMDAYKTLAPVVN